MIGPPTRKEPSVEQQLQFVIRIRDRRIRDLEMKMVERRKDRALITRRENRIAAMEDEASRREMRLDCAMRLLRRAHAELPAGGTAFAIKTFLGEVE